MRMTMIVLMVLISNRARQARQRRQSALAPFGRQKKKTAKGKAAEMTLVLSRRIAIIACRGDWNALQLPRAPQALANLHSTVPQSGRRETLIPPLTFKSRHLIQFPLWKVRQAFSFLSFRMLFQATTFNVLLLLPVSVAH